MARIGAGGLDAAATVAAYLLGSSDLWPIDDGRCMGGREVLVKGLKTTIAAAMVVGLMAGSAVAAAAQDGASSEAAFVTGTVGASTVIGEPVSTIADGVENVRGLVREGPIEMSDPRLTGSLSRVLNFSVHPVGDDGALVIQTDLWRIENDGGSWAGPGTAMSGIGEIPSDITVDLETVVLTGEGGYDGLSAYLVADWSPETGADMQGAIFTGEMPPLPEEIPAGE